MHTILHAIWKTQGIPDCFVERNIQ